MFINNSVMEEMALRTSYEIKKQFHDAIILYFGNIENAEMQSKNCEMKSYTHNNKNELWHMGRKIFTVDYEVLLEIKVETIFENCATKKGILENLGYKFIEEYHQLENLFYKDYYWVSTKSYDKDNRYTIIKSDTKEKAIELLLDDAPSFNVELFELEKFLTFIK